VLDDAEIERVLRLNVLAAVALVKGFRHRHVIAENGGSAVLISSVMGLVGAPGCVAYSLSKAAVHGAVRSLALELAGERIRVNSVAPACVATPMFDEMAKLWSDDQRARVSAMHPLGIGQPEDVANAVAFLLADTGRWITGTVLVVDGGYTAA